MWFLIIIIAVLFAWTFYRLSYFSSQGVRTLPVTPFFGNLTGATFARENFIDIIAAGYDTFSDQR